MPVLQGRKPGYHCCFRAARSAAGLSFRHPTFVCEITFAGKGICVLQRRKTAENTHKDHKRSQKKAVLPKNCFVILNSKIENSIDCQNTAEKPPEVPFNGLSFLVLQTKRKLSYYLRFFLLFKIHI
ncbi:hypothetical protein EGH90_02455 [Kaistella haifensis]|nr:hypothetical protein EGH90_02455 [Kaistella haifensis]